VQILGKEAALTTIDHRLTGIFEAKSYVLIAIDLDITENGVLTITKDKHNNEASPINRIIDRMVEEMIG